MAAPLPPMRIVVVVAVVVGLVVVYAHDPAAGGLFPPCPFFATTGFLCPGCGGTRALHALLHGEFVDAVRFNAFALLVVPLWIAGELWVRRWPAHVPPRWRGARGRFGAVVVGVGAAVLWGVARNLWVIGLHA